MKNLTLTLGFVFISLMAVSQTTTPQWPMPYNEEKKAFIYEEVVEVPGAVANDLFTKASTWVSTYFPNYTSKIIKSDPATLTILLKDRMQLFKIEKKVKVNDVVVDYKIDLNFKDGKFKYTIYNFRSFEGSTSPNIEVWMDPNKCEIELATERYTNININILALIENLKKYMTAPAGIKNDSW